MKLAWLTDIHLDCVEMEDVTRLAEHVEKLADAALITGDISNSAWLDRHLRLFAAGCSKPIYFLLGNHDVWCTSFAHAAEIATRVAEEVPNLHYLPRRGPVEIGSVLLVGVDGFYDARSGDPFDTSAAMNDWYEIDDFAGLSRPAIVDLLQKRGAADAERVHAELLALPHHDRILFATHVPPFPEVVTRTKPWYTNLALGRVLSMFADERPRCSIDVLAGHVHSSRQIVVRGNLRARTARAVYGKPEISDILEMDRAPR